MRNGNNFFSSKLSGFLQVEEPRVPVIERYAVVILVVQKFLLVLVLTAMEFQSDEYWNRILMFLISSLTEFEYISM
jgi:hypothetical protein